MISSEGSSQLGGEVKRGLSADRDVHITQTSPSQSRLDER